MRPVVLAAVAAALLAVPAASPAPKAVPAVDLIAVGDIANCNSEGDEATARLVDRLRGPILALGDTVYERGSDEEYAACFQPSWGRHKSRIRPVVGNHEYGTDGAQGYFRYFGAKASPPNGWYSTKLGSWRLIVLNTNCGEVGGCEAGSPQHRWLTAALARNKTRCTIAAMHHPRYSSGFHGNDDRLQDLWVTLSRGGVDVVVAGHEHSYERFGPRDRMRSFIVGTGGTHLRPVLRREPVSRVIEWQTWGVLTFRLLPGRFSWRFVPVPGSSFRDVGAAPCR
jgi:3',5'-cyclic AMP phosphodiesterase CpdA